LIKSLENVGAKIVNNKTTSSVTFQNEAYYKIDRDFVTIYTPDSNEKYPEIINISCASFYNLDWKLSLNHDKDKIDILPINVNGIKLEEFKIVFNLNDLEQNKKLNNNLNEDNNKFIEFSNIIRYIKSEILRINPQIKHKSEIFFG